MNPLFILLGALLLGALGGLVFARGWWLDRFAGNHRRPRCRKCWMDAPADACRAGDSWQCPRCGTVAVKAKQLHRVRRNKVLTAVGVLLLCGAAGVAASPMFRFVLWMNSIPQGVAVAWWPFFGATEIGRELARPESLATMPADSLAVMTKQAEEYFSNPANTVLRGAFDLEAALQILTLARIRNDNAVELARAQLLPKSSGNDLRAAASAYLAAAGFSSLDRLEMHEAELGKVKEQFALQRTFENIVKKANAGDDELLELLLRVGTRRGTYEENRRDPDWLFAENVRIAMFEVASGSRRGELLASLRDEFRRASTEDRRDEVWAAYNYAAAATRDGIGELVPFILEVGELPRGLTRTRRRVQILGQSWQCTPEEMKELFSSGSPVRIELAASLAERSRDIPEGSGKYLVEYFRRSDDSAAGRIGSSLGFLQGADRLLLLEALNDRDVNESARRWIIKASGWVQPPLEEAAPILMRLQADPQQPEEIRVDARNALRGMRKWPPLDGSATAEPTEK